MLAKNELQQLINALSECECKYLLTTVKNIITGERFWEDDFGIFYNEYAKIRAFSTRQVFSNSTPSGSGAAEDIFAPIPIVKSYSNVAQFQLPRPKSINVPLSEILAHRRSHRNYSGAAISLDHFSTLLYYACGVTGFAAAYGYNRLPLRSFPSSGGLQTPETYLVIQSVEGIPPGLYHYHPINHALECLKRGNYGATLRILTFEQPYMETSSVIFLVTGNYERLRWKYGERSYRYLCIDAGFLGENIYLVAEALDLGVCAHSGFAEDALEEFIGIDGKNEIALLLITIGVRSDYESTPTFWEEVQPPQRSQCTNGPHIGREETAK